MKSADHIKLEKMLNSTKKFNAKKAQELNSKIFKIKKIMKTLLIVIILFSFYSASAQREVVLYTQAKKTAQSDFDHYRDSVDNQTLLDKIFPTKDGKIIYEAVVDSPLAQEDLRNKALEWAANEYVDAQSVIKMSNSNTLLIKGTYTSELGNGQGIHRTQSIKYTLKIQFKENKYRYSLTDIIIETRAVVPGTSPVQTTYRLESVTTYTTKFGKKKRAKINSHLENIALNRNADFELLLLSLDAGMAYVEESDSW